MTEHSPTPTSPSDAVDWVTDKLHVHLPRHIEALLVEARKTVNAHAKLVEDLAEAASILQSLSEDYEPGKGIPLDEISDRINSLLARLGQSEESK